MFQANNTPVKNYPKLKIILAMNDPAKYVPSEEFSGEEYSKRRNLQQKM
jgi:hypothetical protein